MFEPTLQATRLCSGRPLAKNQRQLVYRATIFPATCPHHRLDSQFRVNRTSYTPISSRPENHNRKATL